MRGIVLVLIWICIGSSVSLGSTRLDSIYQLSKREVDFENSENHLEEFENSCVSHEDYEFLADFYFMLANKSRRLGLFQESSKYYNLSFLQSIDLKDLNRQRKCMVNQSLLYFTASQYEEANYYSRQAIKLAEELGMDDKIARSYFDIGLQFRVSGVFDSAIIYQTKALSKFRAIEDNKWVSYTLIDLGICAYEIEEYDAATDFYYKAIAASDTSKLIKSIVLNNHSLVALKSNDTIRAMNLINESIDLKESLNQPDAFFIPSLNQLGELHYHNKNYDSALRYFKRAFSSNNLNGSDGCTYMDYKLSYFYIDSIAKAINQPYLLTDSGITDTYISSVDSYLVNIEKLEKEHFATQLMIAKSDYEKYADKKQAKNVKIALTISILALFVLLYFSIQKQYKKRKLKRNLELFEREFEID